IEDCVTLEKLAEQVSAGTLDSCVLPIERALSSWPTVQLTERESADILHGRPINRKADGQPDRTLVLLKGERDRVQAVARVEGEELAPVKVLVENSAGLLRT